uniref:Uncharacterized protein n=1 Tax=Myotis myotis TaxID=51298 RepID=A0A7J7SCA4_MYOMY|nr:hypothetical protein mMyoMyo1_009511 [Myotis myotis]
MANKRDPHTPPWAPFPSVPRSAGRTAALNSPPPPSGEASHRRPGPSWPGRWELSAKVAHASSSFRLRGHSRWSWFLNLFRHVSGSLGSLGLLARRPGTWPQCPGCWPGLWASEQTAQESEHLFSLPSPPHPIPPHSTPASSYSSFMARLKQPLPRAFLGLFIGAGPSPIPSAPQSSITLPWPCLVTLPGRAGTSSAHCGVPAGGHRAGLLNDKWHFLALPRPAQQPPLPLSHLHRVGAEPLLPAAPSGRHGLSGLTVVASFPGL